MSGLYFAIYLILFEDYICPFPETVGQTKFHAKKDDKVGKLLINKKGKIEIDSQIKSNFWLVRMREKEKSRLITSD